LEIFYLFIPQERDAAAGQRVGTAVGKLNF